MRTILLDTHVALWLMNGEPKLSPIALQILQRKDSRLLLHQISIWELMIKVCRRNLDLGEDPVGFLRDGPDRMGLTITPLETNAILLLPKLPLHHGDPFDRMIIAHALLHDFEICTADAQFDRYPVKILRP